MDSFQCSEDGCTTRGRWRYTHQGRTFQVCEPHQRQVMHRMEAVGRVGPLVRDPVQLVDIPPIVAPAPNWQHEYRQMKAERDALRVELQKSTQENQALQIAKSQLVTDLQSTHQQLQQALIALKARETVEAPELEKPRPTPVLMPKPPGLPPDVGSNAPPPPSLPNQPANPGLPTRPDDLPDEPKG